MLYALLFLPALLGIAYILVLRRPRVLEEATVQETPFATLDSLLGELERKTLDERDVGELEALAAELEAAAARLGGRIRMSDSVARPRYAGPPSPSGP